jgi:hypothetical protein
MADRFTGLCVGGPLDGREVTVRTPGGFLAVDKVAGRAWRYLPEAQEFRVSTDHDDSLIYPQGATTGERQLDPTRVWQAGEESALDIIAVGE